MTPLFSVLCSSSRQRRHGDDRHGDMVAGAAADIPAGRQLAVAPQTPPVIAIAPVWLQLPAVGDALRVAQLRVEAGVGRIDREADASHVAWIAARFIVDMLLGPGEQIADRPVRQPAAAVSEDLP